MAAPGEAAARERRAMPDRADWAPPELCDLASDAAAIRPAYKARVAPWEKLCGG